MRYIRAVLIRGLRNPLDPTDTAPILFTDSPVSGTLPGELSGAKVFAWLDRDGGAIGGITLTADLRAPVSRGGSAVKVRLVDQDDALSRLFADDPFYVHSPVWSVRAARVATGAVTLRLSGQTAPTEDHVYWLGPEAFQAEGVSAVSGTTNTWSVTVGAGARGVCGSRERVHRLNPAAYAPGDLGIEESLLVHARPPWEAGIEVTIYLLSLSGGASIVWAHHGYIVERPQATGDGRWEVQVDPLTKRVAEHAFGPGREALKLSRCVQVTGVSSQIGQFSQLLPGFAVPEQPVTAALWLTRYEAERLFNEPIHTPGSDVINSTDVTALSSRLSADSAVTYQVLAKVGGHEWLFQINDIAVDRPGPETFTASVAGQSFVRVRLSLLYAPPMASLSDTPVAFPATGLLAERIGLNEGWSKRDADPLREGEVAPEVTLRVRIEDTPIRTALRLLHSDDGSGAQDAVFDTIIGRIGAGLASALVNQGSASGSPLTVSEGTAEALKLDELLSLTFTFEIDLKEKLGAWLENICHLHTLLFGGIPSTGALAFRLWSRSVVSEVPVALTPLVGPDDVPRLQRLDPLRVILVEVGYDPLTLESRLPPIAIRTYDALAKDHQNALRLRLWVSGAGQDIADHTHNIDRLSRAFFQQLHGQPVVYEVPTFLPDGPRTFGDLVTWADPSIAVPTPTGHGVAARAYIVVGVEVDLATGRQMLHLLPDAVNTVSASAGKIAPTLRVEAVTSIVPIGNTYAVTCQVTSVGEDVFDITTAHSGLWAALDPIADRLRVVRPQRHNPLGERKGWLEASAAFSSIAYSAETGTSGITVLVSGAWERGSGDLAATIEDLFVAGETFLCLSDRRGAESNPESAEISPPAEQLSAAYDALKWAPASGVPFDGHFSLIDS